VALNALSVSRWVRQVGEAGSGRPWVVQVGEFLGVEASRQASLVRVGMRSRASRLRTRVAQIGVSVWVEPQLDLSFRRFSGRGLLGGLFF
jgi:hypothetical protein